MPTHWIYLFISLFLVKLAVSNPRFEILEQLFLEHDHITGHEPELEHTIDNMTIPEVSFMFFRQHDFNEDSNLDGLEILTAFRHKDENVTDNFLSEQVDKVLGVADLDGNGYVSYYEARSLLEEAGYLDKNAAPIHDANPGVIENQVPS